MSAQTRQKDLDGKTVWEQPPTDRVARILFEVGRAADGTPQLGDAARFVAATEQRPTPQVIRWVERAGREGVIRTDGGDRR